MHDIRIGDVVTVPTEGGHTFGQCRDMSETEILVRYSSEKDNWFLPRDVEKATGVVDVALRAVALRDINSERQRQGARWGEQSHTPGEWLAVLTEEVGEVAQEVLRHRFSGTGLDKYRSELVQVAAVAAAAIECLDRTVPAVECDAGCRRLAVRGLRYCQICRTRLETGGDSPA